MRRYTLVVTTLLATSALVLFEVEGILRGSDGPLEGSAIRLTFKNPKDGESKSPGLGNGELRNPVRLRTRCQCPSTGTGPTKDVRSFADARRFPSCRSSTRITLVNVGDEAPLLDG
jgi:hypothetical protein